MILLKKILKKYYLIQKDVCINICFLIIDNYMITYTKQKKGMSYHYDKMLY